MLSWIVIALACMSVVSSGSVGVNSVNANDGPVNATVMVGHNPFTINIIARDGITLSWQEDASVCISNDSNSLQRNFTCLPALFNITASPSDDCVNANADSCTIDAGIVEIGIPSDVLELLHYPDNIPALFPWFDGTVVTNATHVTNETLIVQYCYYDTVVDTLRCQVVGVGSLVIGSLLPLRTNPSPQYVELFGFRFVNLSQYVSTRNIIALVVAVVIAIDVLCMSFCCCCPRLKCWKCCRCCQRLHACVAPCAVWCSSLCSIPQCCKRKKVVEDDPNDFSVKTSGSKPTAGSNNVKTFRSNRSGTNSLQVKPGAGSIRTHSPTPSLGTLAEDKIDDDAAAASERKLSSRTGTEVALEVNSVAKQRARMRSIGSTASTPKSFVRRGQGKITIGRERSVSSSPLKPSTKTEKRVPVVDAVAESIRSTPVSTHRQIDEEDGVVKYARLGASNPFRPTIMDDILPHVPLHYCAQVVSESRYRTLPALLSPRVLQQFQLWDSVNTGSKDAEVDVRLPKLPKGTILGWSDLHAKELSVAEGTVLIAAALDARKAKERELEALMKQRHQLELDLKLDIQKRQEAKRGLARAMKAASGAESQLAMNREIVARTQRQADKTAAELATAHQQYLDTVTKTTEYYDKRDAAEASKSTLEAQAKLETELRVSLQEDANAAELRRAHATVLADSTSVVKSEAEQRETEAKQAAMAAEKELIRLYHEKCAEDRKIRNILQRRAELTKQHQDAHGRLRRQLESGQSLLEQLAREVEAVTSRIQQTTSERQSMEAALTDAIKRRQHAEGVIENARKDRSLLVEPVELAHTQALQLQEQNLHIASVQRRLAEERAVAEEAATKAAKITAQFEEERDQAAKSRANAEALVSGDTVSREAIEQRIIVLHRQAVDRIRVLLEKQDELRDERDRMLASQAEVEAAEWEQEQELLEKLRAIAYRDTSAPEVIVPTEDLSQSGTKKSFSAQTPSPKRLEWSLSNRKPLYTSPKQVYETLKSTLTPEPKPRRFRRIRSNKSTVAPLDTTVYSDTSSDESTSESGVHGEKK